MGDTGFEPVAPTLSWWYSTPELIARVFAQLLILQPPTVAVKQSVAQFCCGRQSTQARLLSQCLKMGMPPSPSGAMLENNCSVETLVTVTAFS